MAVAQPTALSPEATEIAALVARSRAAQAQIANYTQEQVDALIRAMVWSVAREDVAEKIADRHPPQVGAPGRPSVSKNDWISK